MTLDLATRIGVDGKRYPIGGSVPTDTEGERRAVIPIYGVPDDGQIPVWNALLARLEWGTGSGGGEGGEGDVERFEAIETLNATQDDAITATDALLGTTVSRVDDIETAIPINEADNATLFDTINGTLADLGPRLDDVEADARFTDDRYPLEHAASHLIGGDDPITGLVVSTSGITNIETLNQAAYDALSPADANTLYVVVG